MWFAVCKLACSSCTGAAPRRHTAGNTDCGEFGHTGRRGKNLAEWLAARTQVIQAGSIVVTSLGPVSLLAHPSMTAERLSLVCAGTAVDAMQGQYVGRMLIGVNPRRRALYGD